MHKPRKQKRPAVLAYDPAKEVWRAFRSGTVEYEVSNYGRVRRYLRPFTSKNNLYPMVYMSGKAKVHVHNLVAELFLGPRPHGLIVNHKDSNPGNPHDSNLEYVTQRTNIRKAALVTKLTTDQVRDIRKLFAGGKRQYEIAKLYPVVGVHQIYMIVRRKAWVDLA